MGQGTKSVIVWVMWGCEGTKIWLLNADKKPSEQNVSDFQQQLQEIEWPGYDNEVTTDTEDDADD